MQILFATDRRWSEKEKERRGERIVEYAEVEIGIELIATLKFRRILPVSLRLMGIIVFRFNE